MRKSDLLKKHSRVEEETAERGMIREVESAGIQKKEEVVLERVSASVTKRTILTTIITRGGQGAVPTKEGMREREEMKINTERENMIIIEERTSVLLLPIIERLLMTQKEEMVGIREEVEREK